MTKKIDQKDGTLLINTARKAILSELMGQESHPLDVDNLPPIFNEAGASFVTLTINGVLRGCVGSLEATQPLIRDVRDRAIAAAFYDPRFPPLTKDEYELIKVEVSRLTPPQKLMYSTPEDLVTQLRPGIDGVVLHHQSKRATFLPQVWTQLPTPEVFLGRLCVKMGLDSSAWRENHLAVEIYQVEKFIEKD